MGIDYTGHIDAVWSVLFSPDGARIASGSGDKSVIFCGMQYRAK